MARYSDIADETGRPIFGDVSHTVAEPERLRAFSEALRTGDETYRQILAALSDNALSKRYDETVALLSYGMVDADELDSFQLSELVRIWAETFFIHKIDFFIGDFALDQADIIQERADELFGMSKMVKGVLSGVPIEDVLGTERFASHV